MTDLARQASMFSSEKLRSARVGVLGTGPISNFLCAYLAGLGIGTIMIIGNQPRKKQDPKEFLIQMCDKAGPKPFKIKQAVSRINPKIALHAYTSMPERLFLEGCSVVIDTTNDPESKYRSFRYCEDTDRLFVSCSSDSYSGSIRSYSFSSRKRVSLEDIMLKEYSGKEQGSVTSGLMAALAADEVRKAVCPVENDRRLEQRLGYSLFLPERFVLGRLPKHDTSQENALKMMRRSARHRKVLVVGAGGIGNYVLLNLAMAGVQIDVYDGDVIESHNLNRQLLLCGGEGSNKAEEVVKKMKTVSTTSRIQAYPEYITKEMLLQKIKQKVSYDAVFSCVDSWSARRMLNDYCRVTRTPLFNGSVNTFECTVEQFIPGETDCLECSNDYRRRVQDEKVIIGCADLPANVVMPNAIAGALMVAESIRTISTVNPPSLGEQKICYDSNSLLARKFLLKSVHNYCTDKRHYTSICRCHWYRGDKND